MTEGEERVGGVNNVAKQPPPSDWSSPPEQPLDDDEDVEDDFLQAKYRKISDDKDSKDRRREDSRLRKMKGKAPVRVQI